MKQIDIPGVIVIAVTKTVPVERIFEGIKAGFIHFGENYVQEARKKIPLLRKTYPQLVFHMIGHVQSRKAREVVELFDWVDSVDSIVLLERLHRYAKELGKTLHVLLEVNLAGESTKYGFDLAGWEKNAQKLKCFDVLEHDSISLSNIVIAGLMVMPPQVTDPEHNRPIFRSAKRLFEEIGLSLRAKRSSLSSEGIATSSRRDVGTPRNDIVTTWQHLSMGTSQDYRVAIEEGATMVRLGTAIFGPRT